MKCQKAQTSVAVFVSCNSKVMTSNVSYCLINTEKNTKDIKFTVIQNREKKKIL